MSTSSAARQFVTWIPLAALLIVLLPAASAAQEPVKSFDQLNTRLKPGDTVWVTDAEGREIEGKVRALTPSALTLDNDGQRTIHADAARLVRQRQPDSLKNGALIGLAVGAGVGLAMAGACEEDASGACGPIVTLIFAGIGTGIGVGIDALIPGKKQVVYRAPAVSGSARLSIGPVITPRAKGVAVSFSF